MGQWTVDTHRYAKQVPGHHVQVDVKFLTLRDRAGQRLRRDPDTAIDDATRIRALRVYRRHTQQQAIVVLDHVVQTYPFRILNGKVERSHRTGQQEFYQLLTYKGDVDLAQRLAEWEQVYNYQRPHGAFHGKTPYEALRETLQHA